MKCIERLGKWELFEDGSLEFQSRYFIPANELADGWIEHLNGKSWIDFNHFIPLYIMACEINKINKVVITHD